MESNLRPLRNTVIASDYVHLGKCPLCFQTLRLDFDHLMFVQQISVSRLKIWCHKTDSFCSFYVKVRITQKDQCISE